MLFRSEAMDEWENIAYEIVIGILDMNTFSYNYAITHLDDLLNSKLSKISKELNESDSGYAQKATIYFEEYSKEFLNAMIIYITFKLNKYSLKEITHSI